MVTAAAVVFTYCLCVASASRRKVLTESEEEFLEAAEIGHLRTVKSLLESGNIDVNVVGVHGEKYYGRSALYLAAEEGHLNVVNFLLDQEMIDVNKHAKEDGWTVLHISIEKERKSVVLKLLEVPDINVLASTKTNNFTPLHAAAKKGWCDIVDRLLTFEGVRQQINSKTRRGSTPLIMAVSTDSENYDEMVSLLLDVPNIDVNAYTWDKKSAFLFACELGRTTIVYKLMQRPELDITTKDKYNHSALYFAMTRGHLDVAKMLLRTDHFSIHDTGSGTSFFVLAAEGGHHKLMNYLRKLGVDPKAEENTNAIHLASQVGNMKAVTKLVNEDKVDINTPGLNGDTIFVSACNEENLKMIEFLMQFNDIDINKVNDHGASALYGVVERDLTEVVKVLLNDTRIKVNMGGFNGFGVLHAAVKHDHYKSIRLLVELSDIDVNQATNTGFTPLHLATTHNYKRSLKSLLRSPRIDVTLRNRDGLAALDLAKKDNFSELVEILENALATNHSTHVKEEL